MLTVLAFCNKDQDQAERLAGWMADLGGCRGHEILLGEDSSVTNGNIAALFQQSFDKVTVLPIANPYDSWPSAPNHCYSILARHIENEKLAPYWFWLEPDAVILRSGALDAIEAEYKEVKKPFLGALVTVEGVANHMSGLGIYPGQMTRHAGLALISNDIAWDVGGAEQILPHMHDSKLIAHKWNHKPFENWEQVERDILIPHPEALIYHASKDGSLIDLLRSRMNLPVTYGNTNDESKRGVIRPVSESTAGSSDRKCKDSRVETQRQLVEDKAKPETQGESSLGGRGQIREDSQALNLQSVQATDEQQTPARTSRGLQQEIGSNLDVSGLPQQGGQSFTCDLFLKTFPSDYPWAEYCLRSIDKFCTGFRRVVIIAPDENCPRPKVLPHVVIPVPEQSNGYNWQQVVKLSADQYTDASHILFMDSDCVFTKPVTPQTFIRDSKIMWLMTPLEKAREDQKRAWIPVMTKWLGKEPQYEWMQRHPFMFPRWLCEKVRDFCVFKHGRTLEQYVLEQGEGLTFSEFNCSGVLAYEQFRDQFEWLNTETDHIPEETVLQKWSPGGLTEEIREEFEKILGGTPAETSPIRQTKEGWWVLTHDSHISKWIEETGRLDHDQNTLPLILPEIPVGGVVVDAGAFVGDHTIAYCNQVGPNGMVYAFEPNPDAYECLVRNITNQRPFHPYKMALGNVSDPTSFRAEKFRIEDNSGASHMDADGDQYVQIISLDSFFFDRLDLLKLDVEGFELRALQGAEQTINRCHPVMVIEINDSALKRQGVNKTEVYDWLRAHGYQWMPVQELLVDPPQYDILCKPIRKAGDVECSFTSARYLMENGKYKEVPVPWANREKSIAYIDQLAAELKKFMTAPRSTLVVRERLRKLKVITKVR